MPIRRIALAIFCLFAVPCARAETWPAHPIHIVVPFAAGGAVDITGRLFAQMMQDSLGVPVLIDNRPGAGGNVGTEYVARSQPDGYTILLTTNGHSISPGIFKNLGWKPEDFIPVSLLFSTSIVIVANPASPVQNLGDLIALARSKPGQLNYGATGVGNAFHLTMELLKLRAGFDMGMVSYKSDGEIINALMGREVEIALLPIATAKAQVEGGALRGLASTMARRSTGLPDVPTIAEQGVPNFSAQGYQAFFAPAGTPRPIVDRLYRAAKAAVESPALQKRLEAYAVEPQGSNPDEFAVFYKADVEKFRAIIRDARIPLQD